LRRPEFEDKFLNYCRLHKSIFVELGVKYVSIGLAQISNLSKLIETTINHVIGSA